MAKRCSQCRIILEENKPFHFCCDETMKYCKECSQKIQCKTCKKNITNKKNLALCCNCFGETDLLICNCKIICQNCQRNLRDTTTQCKTCRALLTRVSNSPIQSKQKNNMCEKCQKEIKSCNCPKMSSPLKPKQKEICAECFKREQIDQMYCNYCGHFVCKKCLSKPGFLFICRGTLCTEPILKEEINDFLNLGKKCYMCENSLPEDSNKRYGPDNNLCLACHNSIKQQQPTKIDSILSPKEQVLQSPKVQTKDKNGPESSINKENVSEKLTSSTLPRSPRHLEPVPLNPPPITRSNNYLSPNVPPIVRTDNISNTPQKRQNQNSTKPSPNSSQKQAQTASGGREKSRSNTSMADPTIAVPCSNCKIPYIPRILITTNCKDKHKMCRYCTLKLRGKECDVCKVIEQEHLDKYFCYKQLTGEERQTFNEKLGQDGMSLCWGCNIVLLKNRTINEKGKSYCKSCILRIK